MMPRFVSNHQDSNAEEQKHEQKIKPTFFSSDDSLYCSEENWLDEGEREQESCSYINGDANEQNPFPVLLEHDLSWEDDELSTLLSKEKQTHFPETLGSDPYLDQARNEAVNWILKVTAHYSFSAATALLSVNYLDRFFSSFHFQGEKPWMNQLAAVACLSLAAKVEEVQVPLLLDLQVEHTRYVFEAKTIQRMEILVLSTLEWRMHPVTAISFLDYFARRLGLKDFLCLEFTRRCEHTLLSVISDSRSVLYLPSVMATATMLHVIKSVAPSLADVYQNQLVGILKIDKGNVEESCKLIREMAPTGHGSQSNKRKFGSIIVPGSPNGVMDVSFSSDGSNDSWAVTSSSTPSSVSSSPELLSKKGKAHHHHQDQLVLQRS